MEDLMSMTPFLDALASDSPAPGGGSAAAMSGAMGAALVAMICRLTIGRKKFADVEAEARDILDKADALRGRLIGLVKEDSQAYTGVMEAYRLPKETEEQKSARLQAIDDALREATQVPLETARACAQGIGLGDTIARIGNPNASSDAGVAVLCAATGLRGAALNVHINLAALKDPAFTEQMHWDLYEQLVALEKVEEVYKRMEEAV